MTMTPRDTVVLGSCFVLFLLCDYLQASDLLSHWCTMTALKPCRTSMPDSWAVPYCKHELLCRLNGLRISSWQWSTSFGFVFPWICRNDFRDYCEICFRTYGDRVKNWITMNEPLVAALFGHDLGVAAPGRCSHCRAGNSSTEPYIVSHTHLLAHATAVKLYREKFKVSQRTIWVPLCMPLSTSSN